MPENINLEAEELKKLRAFLDVTFRSDACSDRPIEEIIIETVSTLRANYLNAAQRVAASITLADMRTQLSFSIKHLQYVLDHMQKEWGVN